jgi:uncharacterized membrane protein YfcA
VDILTMAACLSIGSAVAWLIALYTQRGVRLLLWDFPFAVAGAALCAVVADWFAPKLGIIVLVTVGPLLAAFMIFIGDAIRRLVEHAVQARASRQRNADPRAHP